LEWGPLNEFNANLSLKIERPYDNIII